MNLMVQPNPLQLILRNHGQVQQHFCHFLVCDILVVKFGIVVKAAMGLVARSPNHKKLSIKTTS